MAGEVFNGGIKMLKKFKLRFIITISLLLILEIYLLLLGTFPIEIETKNINDEFIIQIHKKSDFPPFDNIDKTIKNVIRAIFVISENDSKSATIYIEAENGEKDKFAKTDKTEAKEITDKINKAISSKTDFKYTTKREDFIFLGILYIFATIFISIPLFFFMKKKIQKQDTSEETINQNQQKQNIDPAEYILFLIKISLYCSALIFCFIALYFFSSFKVCFEVKNTNETSVVQFYKNSFIPPFFKEKDLLIRDVKSSDIKIIDGTRFKKYVLEITNYNNDKIETPVYFYNNDACKYLSDKINEAVLNKTDFKYVDKQSRDNIVAFFFLFVAIIEGLFVFFIFRRIRSSLLKKAK